MQVSALRRKMNAYTYQLKGIVMTARRININDAYEMAGHGAKTVLGRIVQNQIARNEKYFSNGGSVHKSNVTSVAKSKV